MSKTLVVCNKMYAKIAEMDRFILVQMTERVKSLSERDVQTLGI